MANVDLIFQILNAGSDNMSVYNAIQSAIKDPNDSLTIYQDTSSLIASVTNALRVLQPYRILTNGSVATAALIKITADWKDPQKKSNLEM